MVPVRVPVSQITLEILTILKWDVVMNVRATTIVSNTLLAQVSSAWILAKEFAAYLLSALYKTIFLSARVHPDLMAIHTQLAKKLEVSFKFN